MEKVEKFCVKLIITKVSQLCFFSHFLFSQKAKKKKITSSVFFKDQILKMGPVLQLFTFTEFQKTKNLIFICIFFSLLICLVF